MPESQSKDQANRPSARRARTLIEKMSEQGEEKKDAPELQPAKEFLNSVWQGNAVSRIPSGPSQFGKRRGGNGPGSRDAEEDQNAPDTDSPP